MTENVRGNNKAKCTVLKKTREACQMAKIPKQAESTRHRKGGKEDDYENKVPRKREKKGHQTLEAYFFAVLCGCPKLG